MTKKGGMPSYATVDDYIAHQSEEAQKILKELRELIHQAAPGVQELPNKKAPTFQFVNGNFVGTQLMMAAYSKFVSFYPFPSTLEAFSNELREYNLGKGSIQFPLKGKLPSDLIQQMVLHRKNEILWNSK